MRTFKTANKRLLNAAQIRAILERFAREMTKAYGNLDQIVFIGIRTRGPYVAKRLAEFIKKRHGKEIPVGEMDITLYRDDLNALLPGGTIDHTRSTLPTKSSCFSTTCSIPDARCARRSTI